MQMTSGPNLVEIRPRKIDASNRGDHYHLTEADECYYFFEYTSHRDFKFGFANNLISNLKKPVDRAGRSEYRYKTQAIADCSRFLAVTLRDEWLRQGTLVPVPPSKKAADPLYDPRISQICRGISKSYAIDVRELVIQRESIKAAHEGETRPTIDNLLQLYVIDEQLTHPTPQAFGIIDDVLTAGTHYVAMKCVLSARFPLVPVTGIFITRRVFPADDLTEFFAAPEGDG
jgi:hypothetical protein